MKNRYAVLLVMLAAFAAVPNQKAISSEAKGQGGIPLVGGQFSQTGQGSIAICLDPNTFADESCSTAGVLVVPLSVLFNGALTADAKGNSCSSVTEVDSPIPLNASPPIVTPNEHSVANVLNYDSTTGTGDSSFTTYTGGTCNGATFDKTGATEISSGTAHFVITDNGKRIDFLITKVTNSTGSIGDFSLSGTNLRQTK